MAGCHWHRGQYTGMRKSVTEPSPTKIPSALLSWMWKVQKVVVARGRLDAPLYVGGWVNVCTDPSGPSRTRPRP
jgi:hypothetical protein